MKRFPLKALFIGTLMCLVINVVMSYGVLAMGTFNWTGDFISGGAILLLFLLILVYNTPLVLVRRQWALSSQELVLVYTMMIVATAIPTVGLTALSLEISFSLWFFYLFYYVELALFGRLGYSVPELRLMHTEGSIATAQQAMGAMIALVAVALWTARGHLKTAFRAAFSRRDEVEGNGLLRHRTAVWIRLRPLPQAEAAVPRHGPRAGDQPRGVDGRRLLHRHDRERHPLVNRVTDAAPRNRLAAATRERPRRGRSAAAPGCGRDLS